MRVLLTADLHYNHPKSRAVAEDLISQMNQQGGDVLVVIGDTAVADGDWLEKCLSQFTFAGPKLFVAGNHELWTHSSDSYSIFKEVLPKRVRDLGWHWLENDPWLADDFAIIGSVGWYDYTLAPPTLQIPQRFYAHKISPGAAERFTSFAHLFEKADDITPESREVIARWNDGKFVKLGRSDVEFLQEILDSLESQLERLSKTKTILAAVHHLPFKELLPPPHSNQWDFAKAFLGSERIGQLLLAWPAVKHVYCGHSHLPMDLTVSGIKAINIGSGYRWKTYKTLDL